MKLIQSEKTGIYSVRFKTQSGKVVTRNLATGSKKEAVMIVKEAKIEELELAAKINALTKDAITSIVADRNILFQTCVNEWVAFSKVKSRSHNTIYTQSGQQCTFADKSGIKHISDVTSTHVSNWINEPSDSLGFNARRHQPPHLRSGLSRCSYSQQHKRITIAVRLVFALLH